MGADISQFKQADLVKHMPDLAKLDEHGHGEGGRKFVSKSSSITSFPHFSDYSMFPDRFNGKSSPRAILGHSPPDGVGGPHPHFSDYSFYPDKFDQQSQKILRNNLQGIEPQSLPTPSGLISRYNFRIRRSSESTDDHDSEFHEISPDQQQKGHPHRARSLSNSKMYYFDFSLIPDKDPHYAQDQCNKKASKNEPLKEEISVPPSMVIIEETPNENPGGSVGSGGSNSRKMKRIRKTSEPRYGFFDYSMIPDKDPRFFANRSKSNSFSVDEKTISSTK